MLVVMKNTLSNSLLILLLITSFAVFAELYRGVDSEGNVVYSDRPFADAEKFTPPPLSVMDKPGSSSAKKVVEDEKPAEFKYTQFDIASPADNQTIRNEPDLAVSIILKPGLNTEENHSIWLLLDGKVRVKNSKSLAFNIGHVERGAHKIRAQVRDPQDKIVLRSRYALIFVHQSSAR